MLDKPPTARRVPHPARIEPFGMQVNTDGGKCYHAVLYVGPRYSLPPERLSQHRRACARATFSKKLQTILGIIVLAVCILAAGWVGEVDLERFWANLHRFPTYIGQLRRPSRRPVGAGAMS